ncbi:MAG TPA: MmcQ/YjbR family DNA-binding protein [Candidatus Nanoperiomorbaceae bacterium]|nr:MmcQ/YjbR family DNA-binding protein [Candidatus Nanoperiomorbaceae bacterium]HMQ97267.1 MmcQ/YjbR family DNA-binding protein [Candidatus Nanoperiomorbaceae bacterium]HMR86162.1 MmcQ/YjbR family DNA-binding protein [Candidatus Nanoperiomorbaceae bacterium]HMU11973.1 MmcQ/YjbR family DNA-binding protein [Candidatus Nanoperiomorbaceae bacterium]
MNETEAKDYLASMPGAYLDYPFGPGTAVYRAANDKLFALIAEGSQPLRISLKCDPNLAELLRDKYESVLPGYHLNKRHWITVIVTGQLTDDDIRDLARHSFELVKS